MFRLVELSSRETGILEKPGRSDPESDRRETQIRWPQMGPENQVIFLCHRPTSPTSDLLIGEQSFFLHLLVLPQTEQEEWQDIKAQIRKPSILSKSWEKWGWQSNWKQYPTPLTLKTQTSKSLLKTWDFCEMFKTLQSAKKTPQSEFKLPILERGHLLIFQLLKALLNSLFLRDWPLHFWVWLLGLISLAFTLHLFGVKVQ